MSKLVTFKRGFFHKLFGSCLLIVIYCALAYNYFYIDIQEDQQFRILYVFGCIAYIFLNLPLIFWLVMYIVYSLFVSHKQSFSEWMTVTDESR